MAQFTTAYQIQPGERVQYDSTGFPDVLEHFQFMGTFDVYDSETQGVVYSDDGQQHIVHMMFVRRVGEPTNAVRENLLAPTPPQSEEELLAKLRASYTHHQQRNQR